METRLVLPKLATSPASLGGHGTCREGIVPSGLRKIWQAGKMYSSELLVAMVVACLLLLAVFTEPRRQVEINYEKLQELCLQATEEQDGCVEHAEATSREQRSVNFLSPSPIIDLCYTSLAFLLQSQALHVQLPPFAPKNVHRWRENCRKNLSYERPVSHLQW